MHDSKERRVGSRPSLVVEPLGYCPDCGAKAPTKRVEFWQLIGIVIAFQFESQCGYLCKRCIHRYFWSYTLVTLCFGWWGIASFLMTPFVLLQNIFRYAFCLGMPATPRLQAPNSCGAVVSKKPTEQRPKRMEIIWDLPGDAASSGK